MTARTWWATAIAAGLMFAALLAGRVHDRRLPTLKSQSIHGKRRLVTIEEAVREGYVPCVRCEHTLLAAGRPAAAHTIHDTP